MKQQQELKRQREHSQKTANQPQRNQTPEERLMIQTDKESRKQGFSDRGIDFDIQTDQSPAKSEKNWRAQQENQPDNLFDRKGFEQSESGIRLTPEKPDNSPDLNPENPPLQQDNIGEKDDATSYNKRLIGKYFEAREKLKSSDTTQPENTSQTSKKPDHPAPDPQESEAG